MKNYKPRRFKQILFHQQTLILSLLSISFYLFSSTVLAGSITQKIKTQCPQEYQQGTEIVNDYAIRIQPYVAQYGCGVVSAYTTFIDNNPEKIQQWEDNPEDFKIVNNVFKTLKASGLTLNQATMLFDTLFITQKSGKTTFNQHLISAYKALSRSAKRRIRTHPSSMLYLIWAVQISEDSLTFKQRTVLRNLHTLQKTIPLKLLPVAYLLQAQLRQAYPSISPHNALQQTTRLIKIIPWSLWEPIIKDNLALSNIIYLFPPQDKDIPQMQNYSSIELETIKKRYINTIQIVIEQFLQTTGYISFAMEGMSVLAPKILLALTHKDLDYQAMNHYLKAQIGSHSFINFLNQQKNCTPQNFTNLTTQFFSFLSPIQKNKATGKIEYVSYLRGNLVNISKWYANNDIFTKWIASNNQDTTTFIKTLSVLPYAYLKSDDTTRRLSLYLLQNLPGTLNKNAAFILKLITNTPYFPLIKQAPDAEVFIRKNTGGKSIKKVKFLYVLTTPYPSDEDPSIYNRFEEKQPFSNLIPEVISKNIKALNTHDFTFYEKAEIYIDAAFIAIDIASIASGGAGIIAKQTAMFMTRRLIALEVARLATKKAVKFTAKRLTKKKVTTMNNTGKVHSMVNGVSKIVKGVSNINDAYNIYHNFSTNIYVPSNQNKLETCSHLNKGNLQ